ncbi:MAG: DUF29 domain-containing protein [Rhodospirillaceae bacterium]
MGTASNYDSDFYAWAMEQAALIRAGNLAAVDLEHVAEEIESMGKSEKKELISRLAVLLLHLLKWKLQPGKQGSSWRRTILEQRRQIQRHMADNPSLKAKLSEAMADAYGDAIIAAEDETGLPGSAFPVACPWSYDRAMEPDYWPEA